MSSYPFENTPESLVIEISVIFAEHTTVELLLKSGADINLMNKKHDSALMLVKDLKTKNPKKYETMYHIVISSLRGNEELRSPRFGRKKIHEEKALIQT